MTQQNSKNKIFTQIANVFNKTGNHLVIILREGERLCTKILTPLVIFTIILSLGIFTRLWHFRELPPGLNQDEASIGVEAYDLFHFGVDRNGISFPVNFISWGYGMDALYGYVLAPFMVFGLTPLTVRLPALISGILTLPLVYFIGKRIWGKAFGLLAMFLLAISPWHILLSRWGLNENLLPFIFTLGFACLLLSNEKNLWFIISLIFFGLCLYTYGAMYLAVPVFLACAIPILLITKRVSPRNLLIGLFLLLLLIMPIILFIVVNVFDLHSIHLGPITIPRFPVQARFLGMAATSHANPILTMINNIRDLVKLLLIYQTDGFLWNTVVPFGYLYNFSLPLAIIGALLLFSSRKTGHAAEPLLLLVWLFAAICIGIFQLADINRIHLIFIPIIFCAGAFLTWLGKQHKLSLVVMVLVYLVSFIIFYNVYQGKNFRQQANGAFYAGFLPALDFASQMGGQPICVTDNVQMPYIYILFSEKMNPSLFMQEVRYVYPDTHSGLVLSLGRYYFGMPNCPKDMTTTYVFTSESPPENGIPYQVENFTNFHVYYPVNRTP